MGFFDFLRKGAASPAGAAPVDKKVASLGKVAADKRAQTYDRMEAIQGLCDLKSPDAAVALLKRFSFSIDPSITDQEEKELAFRGILDAARGGELPKEEKAREKALEELEARNEQVVEGVRAFAAKAEQLSWPIKILRELLDDEEYVSEIAEMLERFDTEYARNVEPKVQLIIALEDVVSPHAREAVEPFLDDVNETVRFHAVQTSFAQGDAAVVPALVKLLAGEESVRIKNKVAEGMRERGWSIPEELRDTAAKALRDTDEYSVDKSGKIVRL